MDGNSNTKFAQLLRSSMRRSRIPQLRNFALTPLDIAVRLDGKTGPQYWTARLDRNTGRQDWTAILDGKTGRQDWTARLDRNTGRQYWTARLDRNTGRQYWTAILELTANMIITFSVNIYSIRVAGQILRRY